MKYSANEVKHYNLTKMLFCFQASRLFAAAAAKKAGKTPPKKQTKAAAAR